MPQRMCSCIDIMIWLFRFGGKFSKEEWLKHSDYLISIHEKNRILYKGVFNLHFYQQYKFANLIPQKYMMLFIFLTIKIFTGKGRQCNFDFSYFHGYVSWTCCLFNYWMLDFLWELYIQLLILCIFCFYGFSLISWFFLSILITYHLNSILKYSNII